MKLRNAFYVALSLMTGCNDISEEEITNAIQLELNQYAFCAVDTPSGFFDYIRLDRRYINNTNTLSKSGVYALIQLGYLEVIPVVEYEGKDYFDASFMLTEKGKALNVSSECLIPYQRVVSRLVEWTEPGEAGGIKISIVKYEYNELPPQWAIDDKSLYAYLLDTNKIEASSQIKIGLEKTNKGWRVNRSINAN